MILMVSYLVRPKEALRSLRTVPGVAPKQGHLCSTSYIEIMVKVAKSGPDSTKSF